MPRLDQIKSARKFFILPNTFGFELTLQNLPQFQVVKNASKPFYKTLHLLMVFTTFLRTKELMTFSFYGSCMWFSFKHVVTRLKGSASVWIKPLHLSLRNLHLVSPEAFFRLCSLNLKFSNMLKVFFFD